MNDGTGEGEKDRDRTRKGGRKSGIERETKEERERIKSSESAAESAVRIRTIVKCNTRWAIGYFLNTSIHIDVRKCAEIFSKPKQKLYAAILHC